MLLDSDPVRAFMPYPPVPVASAETGPLAGLTLAVKDLFDVTGYRTGGGSPLKLAESDVKSATAPAVQALLDAGARFVGKTHTDELAWSLYGMNPHFGTPINSAAPDRIPGGSSSGSAAAVAAGLADIGVGSDTGGSVRAPASFCGLFGIRPTHGRIPLDGCMALAPSFDACGLFARDIAVLAKAATAMMAPDARPFRAPRLLLATDMAARLAPAPRTVFDAAVAGHDAQPVTVYPAGGADGLYETFRALQAADARRTVVPWMIASGMPLAPGIDQRFAHARDLPEAEEPPALAARAAFRAAMDDLLGDDGVLIAPAVHDAAFRLDAGRAVFDGFRHDAMKLLCVAGLAGLPQVVVPAGRVDGAPFGVSLIGPRGADLSLLAVAAAFAASVRPTAA